MPPEPHSEYSRRLAERRHNVARLAALDGRLSAARGIAFLTGLALLIAAWTIDAVALAWLAVPLVVFAGLVVYHARIVRQLERARQAVAYYETALDRLDDRWAGVGPSGERYLDPDHPYAADLDLFGRASLFQLIARARTRLGEDTLARWLCTPAGVETIRSRQAAVEELRPQLDQREQLALLNAEVHDHLDQNRLLRWSQQPPQLVSRARRLLAVVLAAATIAGLVAWLGFDAPLSALVVPLAAQLLFIFSFRREISRVAAHIEEAGSGLGILAQVLAVIERSDFHAPHLTTIRERLNTEGRPPSRYIARLHRLIQSLNNSLQNQFFIPIAFVLALPVHLVHAVEKWKRLVGPHIPDWLDAVGQFEALSSLAGHAYEHPRDPFPEITPTGPLLDAEQLAHPLLPARQAVPNDVRLGDEHRLILVSGSNMSGKSTLLRTVGTNVVLALAGAPVRARRLRLSPLQVGTAMRINDSLQDGRSLFYSVVARLKSIVDLAPRDLPLLFLLDEILQGTNSHDRRVGAEAVIRRLVDAGAIGLVTTHDLALTEIVDSLQNRAANAHFEDHLQDGRMTFDYRLRPGVVQKSNALELMRMMGLQV
jgi:hypothetical protein